MGLTYAHAVTYPLSSQPLPSSPSPVLPLPLVSHPTDMNQCPQCARYRYTRGVRQRGPMPAGVCELLVHSHPVLISLSFSTSQPHLGYQDQCWVMGEGTLSVAPSSLPRLYPSGRWDLFWPLLVSVPVLRRPGLALCFICFVEHLETQSRTCWD